MICGNCGQERRTSLCTFCGQIHAGEVPMKPRKAGRPHRRQHAFAATSLAARPSSDKNEEAYERIIDVLRECGEATRDALSVLTSLPINIITPRVRELLDEKVGAHPLPGRTRAYLAGDRLVEPDGDTAPTRSGRMAKLVKLQRSGVPAPAPIRQSGLFGEVRHR